MFGILTAIGGAGLFALMGSRLGYVGNRVSAGLRSIFTVVVMAVAGAVVAIGIGLVVAWLYQVVDTTATVIIPMIVGASIGALAAWRGLARGSLRAGIGVYYISRTISNTLRSIEPLVMALVFVIWVGLGPFAGSLALGLHTIASLTKLYSEQVESISTGPGRSGESDRSDSSTDSRLRRSPSDRRSLYLFHDVPLGHKRPDVHHHRLRWRRRDRLHLAAKHRAPQLSSGRGPDVGYCDRGRLHGLHLKPAERTLHLSRKVGH